MEVLVRSILYIDDSLADTVLMKRALVQAHITSTLTCVANCDQAIDYLTGNEPYSDRRRFPLPQVIFLDLRMPQLSGNELLTWIKDSFPSAPPYVIILSHLPESAERAGVTRDGAHDFCSKPPGPELFERQAAKLNLRWLRDPAPAVD